jgi:hypothetical protein
MNDLKYPFGNPYKERLEDYKTFTALKNVVKLAKDKLRYVKGEPEELMMMSESADAINAELSVSEIERLIEYIDAKKETNT